MTRFKKELLKLGVQLEETLPYVPYEHIECIIVHSDRCVVSIYDNRIGWYYKHYGRDMKVDRDKYEGEEWYTYSQTEQKTF